MSLICESGTNCPIMATIVRVKRRRDDDPLEMLLLSQKKLKIDGDQKEKDTRNISENVLRFAGTVYSKVEHQF